MKRRMRFFNAAVALGAAAAAPALAEPSQMFMINAVSPGVVSFSGEGTAQFNNGSTTANAFSVGSSTNFGVNASASSTNDYMVDSNALLSLAGTSQLQQTIGTSSSAANTMAAAEAASTAATTIANRETTSAFGQDWNDYTARNGVDSKAAGADTSTLEYKTEAAYKGAKNEFYNAKVNEAFSNVTTASTESSSQGASGQGIIKGDFVTTNSSTTNIGASADEIKSMEAKANSSADSKFGASYTEYTAKFSQYAGSNGKIDSAAEVANAKADGFVWNETSGAALAKEDASTGNVSNSWSDLKTASVESTFEKASNAASSQGKVENNSTATVTVTGVGSIATLNASEDSSFNVDVATRLRGSLPDTNGVANGSAGGNLATSSFANQSNTQSANAFMQAFGPTRVDLEAGTITGPATMQIKGTVEAISSF